MSPENAGTGKTSLPPLGSLDRSAGAPYPPDGSAASVLHELECARREAQADATRAYDAWSERTGTDAYAVYRAARDRADAAQDALAAWFSAAEPSECGRSARWSS
jgi:hypothetical protein